MSVSKENFDLNPRQAKIVREKKAKVKKEDKYKLIAKMGNLHPSEHYPYSAAIEVDKNLSKLGYYHNNNWSWSKKSDKGIITVSLYSSFASEYPILSIENNKKEIDFELKSIFSSQVKKYL